MKQVLVGLVALIPILGINTFIVKWYTKLKYSEFDEEQYFAIGMLLLGWVLVIAIAGLIGTLIIGESHV